MAEMNAMLDLFDTPVVPGLAMRTNVITPAEEAALIARIDDTSRSPFPFQQWTGKRLTCPYGWSHDFESGTFAPTEPMPDWLGEVKARTAALLQKFS